MKLAKIKIILSFFCLSFLTCGFPIFIMQGVNYYHVDHASAGALEVYFNLTRVCAAFLIFTLFLKFGYRRPIGIAFLGVALVAALQPIVDSIWTIRLFMLLVGVAYVTINVGCYSMVSLVTKNQAEHASFINTMEGLHMFASMFGMWLFSFFTKDGSNSWLNTFWVIAAVCAIMSALFLLHSIDHKPVDLKRSENILQVLRKLPKYLFTPRVFMAVFLLVCYELIEVGMGSWLHNFNHEVLQLPEAISIQIGSFFVMSIAIGRLTGGVLFKYFKFYHVLLINYIVGFVLIAFALTLFKVGLGHNVTSIFNAPIVAFLLPALGLFIGPTYPTITSTLLSKIPAVDHSIIMSMLMIIVAVADSASTRLVGSLFGSDGGIYAVGISVLLPLGILFLFILPYGILNKNAPNANQQQ
jgi:FHS family glucose/mannose:H+ symporter-like MFS transporter